ncbi:DUF320 domain-containing protein [Streptomyces finlayi]|uniref:DUF320 domain-containing protein n=1 Tax=Streptomyces finlayi TaxID=67296 RepID=A0A7G7BSH7_9ACTN|nr:chaplin [Streptomyces finlayi]QNE78292.1 DUF320 domain-containing protein [Streptomyces finlayi]
MRQVTRKGLITMAAAGGVLVLSGGYAHADAGAAGSASNSPGVLSGNSVQIPIDVPVNVCGNSVSVGGLLNPAAGNDCGNGSADTGQDAGPYENAPGGDNSGGRPAEDPGTGGYDEAEPGTPGTGRHRAPAATAVGQATGSPGVGSGNHVAVPVDIPVNVCGNSVTIGGLLNPVFGNDCGNDAEVIPPTEHPETPTTPGKPADPVHPPVNGPSEPNAPEPQLFPEEQLAQTGAGGLDLLIPAGAGLLLAGAGTVLYRRSRSAA